jgi:hypothetical protein
MSPFQIFVRVNPGTRRAARRSRVVGGLRVKSGEDFGGGGVGGIGAEDGLQLLHGCFAPPGGHQGPRHIHAIRGKPRCEEHRTLEIEQRSVPLADTQEREAVGVGYDGVVRKQSRGFGQRTERPSDVSSSEESPASLEETAVLRRRRGLRRRFQNRGDWRVYAGLRGRSRWREGTSENPMRQQADEDRGQCGGEKDEGVPPTKDVRDAPAEEV